LRVTLARTTVLVVGSAATEVVVAAVDAWLLHAVKSPVIARDKMADEIAVRLGKNLVDISTPFPLLPQNNV
jgi:hypothetical protein